MKLRLMMLLSFSLLFSGGVQADDAVPVRCVENIFSLPPVHWMAGHIIFSFTAPMYIVAAAQAGNSHAINAVVTLAAMTVVNDPEDAVRFATEFVKQDDDVGNVRINYAGVVSVISAAAQKGYVGARMVVSFFTTAAREGNADAAALVAAFAQEGVTFDSDFDTTIVSSFSDPLFIKRTMEDVFLVCAAVFIDAAIAGDISAFDVVSALAGALASNVAEDEAADSSSISDIVCAATDDTNFGVAAKIMAFFDAAAAGGFPCAGAVVSKFDTAYAVASMNVPVLIRDAFVVVRARARAAIAHAAITVLPAAHAVQEAAKVAQVSVE